MSDRGGSWPQRLCEGERAVAGDGAGSRAPGTVTVFSIPLTVFSLKESEELDNELREMQEHSPSICPSASSSTDRKLSEIMATLDNLRRELNSISSARLAASEVVLTEPEEIAIKAAGPVKIPNTGTGQALSELRPAWARVARLNVGGTLVQVASNLMLKVQKEF